MAVPVFSNDLRQSSCKAITSEPHSMFHSFRAIPLVISFHSDAKLEYSEVMWPRLPGSSADGRLAFVREISRSFTAYPVPLDTQYTLPILSSVPPATQSRLASHVERLPATVDTGSSIDTNYAGQLGLDPVNEPCWGISVAPVPTYLVDAEASAPAPSMAEPSVASNLNRKPNCARCRNHDVQVAVKGHKYRCPYRSCECESCILIKERQVIMKKSVALRRRLAPDLETSIGRARIADVPSSIGPTKKDTRVIQKARSPSHDEHTSSPTKKQHILSHSIDKLISSFR